MKFKGLIFDMDGTITVPVIDFRKIRKELNVEEGKDLLELANSLPKNERQSFLGIIEKHELKALENIQFQLNA